MNKTIKHKDFFLKIYIEDTDFQGFVYHANYIKFFERARSDFLSNNNISQEQHRNDGFVFVVKKIEIDYLTTSKLGDTLIVQSSVYKKSNARMIFNQKIINQIDNKIICEGDVEICFINIYTKKPKPFPDDLLLIFDKGEIMNDISVINLFLEAGMVVKIVMLILLLASVLTWIVIVERYNFYKKIKDINSSFIKDFGVAKI